MNRKTFSRALAFSVVAGVISALTIVNGAEAETTTTDADYFYLKCTIAEPRTCTEVTWPATDPTPTPSTTQSSTPSPTLTTTVPPTTVPPTTTTTTTTIAPSPTQSGFPNADNTGVPAGTTLKVSTGNRIISLPNAVISGEQINGCVEVRASDVTIKNSIINAAGCFYGVRNLSSGLKIIDSEITCGNSNGTGVSASRYTLLRVDIWGCENGLNIGGDVTMEDSYLHNLYIGGTDPHTDGVQMNQGAANIVLRHNYISVPMTPKWATSSIIMWDEANPQNSNVLVENNLLQGGGYVIYCPRNPATNIRVINNRLYGWGYGPQNSCWPPNITEWSGNINHLTGTLITT